MAFNLFDWVINPCLEFVFVGQSVYYYASLNDDIVRGIHFGDMVKIAQMF